MKLLYVVFVVISVAGCAWAQPLEAEENVDEVEINNDEHFYLDELEPETATEVITNSTLDENVEEEVIDPANHRFGNGPSATLGSSCVVAIFEVDRTVSHKSKKNKFGKPQQSVILKKGSAKNANAIMGGHYFVGSARDFENVRSQLVVKQTPTKLIRISRIYISREYGIAILKACIKYTRVAACDIVKEQICPTSTCSAIPQSFTASAFRAGQPNRDPAQTITTAQGTSIPCPDNRFGRCCFTSSQTICPSDNGGGVYSGRNLIGIINTNSNNNNCQPQNVYDFTALTDEAALKLYRIVSLSLDCESCVNLPLRYPEYV